MYDAGLIIIVTLISPFRNDRNTARKLFPHGDFIEVYIDTPLEECARRDPKGLYEKVKAGKIKNFTGIDSVYEPPTNAEIHIDTMKISPEKSADMIIENILQITL